MTHVLGIDLGGTKVLAGVINVKTGEVLSSVKKQTRAEHNAEDLLTRLESAASQALDESGVKTADIKRIGVGVAGQIDRQRGVVIAAPNLAHMADVPLAERLRRKLDKRAYLFNDVEAAAAGESSFGSGAGENDFVVVFVGTGIGGMIYRGGKPYKGATETAGEIGHIVIDVNGRICGCGGLGHLEAYGSRTAIVRTLLAAMHSGRESVLGKVATEINPNDPGGSGIRSKAIASALEAGDALVEETLATAADYLAAGLASAVNFYNPPLIILGGGLVEAVPSFLTMVTERTKHAALQVPRQNIRVVKTGLGDFSGIVGAAVLASGK